LLFGILLKAEPLFFSVTLPQPIIPQLIVVISLRETQEIKNQESRQKVLSS